MKKIEFEQQKSSRLMVVNQEISKHQDSNAGNETKKKLFLDVKSIFVKFLIENLMKDIKTLVRENHAFDYEINPYWYQFPELLGHQQSDAKIKISVFLPNPYREMIILLKKFRKQTSM